MDIFLRLRDLTPPAPKTPVSVAIGVFDGVHIAHRRVIDAAVDCARRRGGYATVFTFSTYPISYLRPGAAVLGLTPWPLRLALMEQRGVDRVVAPVFNEKMAEIRASAFIRDVLQERLGATDVFVGFNFNFGRRREGTSATLASQNGSAFRVVDVADPIQYEGLPVSSTRLRRAVLDGDLFSVEAMLGRPYAFFGPVVRGDARGGPLGIPTANLQIQQQPVPPPGIFGSRAILEDGRSMPSLTYVGSAPTFRGETTDVRVENMLLGDAGNLYGQQLLVELLTRIRGEVRFESADSLVAQIRRDEQTYRTWLSMRRLPRPTPFPTAQHACHP